MIQIKRDFTQYIGKEITTIDDGHIYSSIQTFRVIKRMKILTKPPFNAFFVIALFLPVFTMIASNYLKMKSLYLSLERCWPVS